MIYFLLLLYSIKNTTQNILSKIDYFGSLENSNFKYKEKGSIVIMDNFNARKSIENHCQCLDKRTSFTTYMTEVDALW